LPYHYIPLLTLYLIYYITYAKYYLSFYPPSNSMTIIS